MLLQLSIWKAVKKSKRKYCYAQTDLKKLTCTSCWRKYDKLPGFYRFSLLEFSVCSWWRTKNNQFKMRRTLFNRGNDPNVFSLGLFTTLGISFPSHTVRMTKLKVNTGAYVKKWSKHGCWWASCFSALKQIWFGCLFSRAQWIQTGSD